MAEEAGRGAPTKYQEEYNEQVYRLCLLGATDKEMADFFNVCEATFNNWKRDFPEFLVSIKAGKIDADAKVAQSLFKRATGYRYDEVTYEKINVDVDGVEEASNDDIKTEVYKKKIVTKEVAPDVAAQNIWLKNRRGKAKVDEGAQHWADRQETGLTNNNGDDLEGIPILFK